jgi:hypothetical protein
MEKLTTTEYFETVAMIDFWFFALEQLKKDFLGRKPIEIMIDKSTGYDKEREKIFEREVKKIVAKIKKLQSKLPQDDPHFT